jgi:cytochrome c oxidase assembly protein subunit 15
MQTDSAHSTRGPAGETTFALRLARGFGLLVVLAFGLITLGALVRAHNAGLACPDWPLCFGEFIPQINLHVGFEWTHRVVAGSVSLIFVALAIPVLRRPSTRQACAGLLGLAAVLLAVQVMLGALTVWKLLADWTVTAHLVTGNGFTMVLLWIALALHEHAGGAGPPAPTPSAVRSLVAVVAVLLVAQIVLGGLVASRYAGLACPEWPTCDEGLWAPSWRGRVGLHLLHRLTGYALFAALAATAFVTARIAPGLRRIAGLACGLGLAQLGVGIANVLLDLPVELTGLHTALAAGLVLSVSVAVRESWLRAPA